MPNCTPIKVDSLSLPRAQQGDIFSNIDHIESLIPYGDNNIEINRIVFPYVIVLSQDCDLEQDSNYYLANPKPSNDDKKLFSVIVAPLYNEEYLLTGSHLSDIGLTMQKIERGSAAKPTTNYKNLIKNEIPRYHHIVFPGGTPMVNSVIDFKHYFTVNSQYLIEIKPKQFVCKVSELYRERISQRFSNFLSRIGLPE